MFDFTQISALIWKFAIIAIITITIISVIQILAKKAIKDRNKRKK